MNTPLNGDNANLRYAEYVLGVLDADARAEVAHEVQTSEAAAVAVTLWERRLQPLHEEIPASDPPAYVWARLQNTLQLDVHSHRQPAVGRPSLRENLRFWHWLSLGTSVLATACIAMVLLSHRPSAPATPFMASTITQTDGQVGWTATMDIPQGRIIVVPATPQRFSAGRAPELWLIPDGQKPISVGMIATNAPTTLSLDPTLLAKLGPTAALAVSVEPVGGSPTGQPTGPVIAKGAIGAAPDNGGQGKSVAIRVPNTDRNAA